MSRRRKARRRLALGLGVFGLVALFAWRLAPRDEARAPSAAPAAREPSASSEREPVELRPVVPRAPAEGTERSSATPEPASSARARTGRGAELTARVTDRYGAPVGRFRLEAVALDAGGALLSSEPFDAPDGTARWSLPRAGEWAVSALAGELRSDPATVRVPGAVTLGLPRPAEIEGRVVDQRGAPVPAAAVELERVFPAGRAWGERVTRVSTDALGLFFARELTAGSWVVRAAAPGLLESAGVKLELAEGDRADVGELVLHDGGVIEGRFHPAVRVPPGCRVWLWSLRRRRCLAIADVEASAFRFTGLSGGYVVALGPGPVPARTLRGQDFLAPPLFVEEVVVRQGETTEVELGGGDEVEPMTGEKPVAGVVGGGSGGWVLIVDEQSRACRLDAQGRFSARVSAGPFVLVATGPRVCVGFWDLWKGGTGGQLDLSVPAGVLEGRFDSSRTPRHVALVEVGLFGPGTLELIDVRHASVAPDGSFRIEALRPTGYLVYADDGLEPVGHVTVGAEGVTRVSLR